MSSCFRSHSSTQKFEEKSDVSSDSKPKSKTCWDSEFMSDVF